MNQLPSSYVRTGKKAKAIVAKMLNVPEQVKSLPGKMYNQYAFVSKLLSSEAVGRNGGATAFYNGKYEIKVKLDKNEVPFVGKDQIDVKKLQSQILSAVEEARRNNHVHKYYEKSLYDNTYDDALAGETYSKGTQYASNREEIRNDFTQVQEDDENQYMFKKVLQQMQKLEMDFQEDMREYKKYMTKQQDANFEKKENVSRVPFTTAFNDLVQQFPLSEGQKSNLALEADSLSDSSSKIIDDMIDLDGWKTTNVDSLTYDARLDPDAMPLGPFISDMIMLKRIQTDIENYEKENGEGSFKKYMLEQAGTEMSESFAKLESLSSLMTDKTSKEILIRSLFGLERDYNVDEIVKALSSINSSFSTESLEEKIEEPAAAEEKTEEESAEK